MNTSSIQPQDMGPVAHHYTVSDLAGRLLSALADAGKDIEQLSIQDLAPIDGFHIRGRVATEELAGLAAIQSNERVLDVGAGIGGTARFLASTTGCQVVGLDVTPSFCDVATDLTRRCGLSELATYRVGSALELPFEDGSFDVVWTEHVQMNIADKRGFYAEMARVLKPGGRLAFHDIFAGPGEAPLYPVPWAAEKSLSHLLPADELPGLLSSLGYEPQFWDDVTGPATDFFAGLFARIRNEGWPPLGMHLLLDDAEQKLANLLANLRQGSVQVRMAVLRT